MDNQTMRAALLLEGLQKYSKQDLVELQNSLTEIALLPAYAKKTASDWADMLRLSQQEMAEVLLKTRSLIEQMHDHLFLDVEHLLEERKHENG